MKNTAKVIHIESGLGNQMLSFCEYLAIKKVNPDDQVYVETIIYDIPECHEVINQWNGYELSRIFGINVPNVRSLFDDRQWQALISEIRSSEFWVLAKHNWNYPVYFTEAFRHAGLPLTNLRGDFESAENMKRHQPNKNSLRYRLRQTTLFYYLQAYKRRQPIPVEQLACRQKLFVKTSDSIFTGQQLLFKYKGSGIEDIADDIRHLFTFPPLADKQNIETAQHLSSCNSVAIHARRGDMANSLSWCYKSGYFRRAVAFIRKKVTNPVFVFFTDPGSTDWCRHHAAIFGLDFHRDQVLFVDWNKGENSYIDMQLMSCCHHAIITTSTFGWWSAWLNAHPDKITISPDYRINTTHTL